MIKAARHIEEQVLEEASPDAGVALERAWVDAALAGDGTAFAALVRPHLPLLYRISARVCRDPALAEDAVQEALTVAYQQLHRYTPGTSLKAHLAGIAVRRAHTLLRSEVRRGLREIASPVPARSASPEELVTAGAEAVRVRRALVNMPEKRREAALLRLDGGLSYAEIAQALGTSEGSARVLVHLALTDLRRLLEAPGGAE